ncbi:MAG: DUF6036 family nucleotidyltransferase [Solirubrobacteraceae bacterium]
MESLLRSQEADIYPRKTPDKAIEIEGALGDGSHFHQTYGYYAHAVGPETAKAPAGWEDRLVVMEVPPRVTSTTRAVAFCLEPHDLILSKLAANRERDWEFARDALAAKLVDLAILLERVGELPVHRDLRRMITAACDRRGFAIVSGLDQEPARPVSLALQLRDRGR